MPTAASGSACMSVLAAGGSTSMLILPSMSFITLMPSMATRVIRRLHLCLMWDLGQPLKFIKNQRNMCH